MGTNCKHYSDEHYKDVMQKVKDWIDKSGISIGKRAFETEFKAIADVYITNTLNGDVSKLTVKQVLSEWFDKNARPGKIVTYPGKWTRRDVASKENQDKLFIFLDNTDRDSGNVVTSGAVSDSSWYAKTYGTGHRYPSGTNTSAVIRGLDNARPISTQRFYHLDAKREGGRWTNENAEEFKRTIHKEVDDILLAWKVGNYTAIVFPEEGLLAESDITDLNGEDRTKIKRILESELKRLFEVVGVEYSEKPELMEESPEKMRERLREKERKERMLNVIKARKWNTFAEEGQGFEVGLAGDEFGKKFSPLVAVFNDDTPDLTIKVGKETDTFHIAGLSIEAAFQLIKGYKKNGKGPLVDADGKMRQGEIDGMEHGVNKAPISKILKTSFRPGDRKAREELDDFMYKRAYLPLWQIWCEQNAELKKELKAKAKDKILTNKRAKDGLNPARALAECLWNNTGVIPEQLEEKYKEERDRAKVAADEIISAIPDGTMQGVELANPNLKDMELYYAAMGRDSRGNNLKDAKHYIIPFPIKRTGFAQAEQTLNLMYNPFQKKDGTNDEESVRKFIEWIIPDDYDSLPSDLRVEQKYRNNLRGILNKGGYKKQSILYRGDDTIYAKALRYIIDNFENLKNKYNPVDIRTFGAAKHNVRVETETRIGNENFVTRFAPNESAEKEELTDDNSLKLERIVDNNSAFTNKVVVRFPNNFKDKFSSEQLERMFKTMAMSLEPGCSVFIEGVVTDDMIDAFEKLTKIGFTKTGSIKVTLDDGTSTSVGVFTRNAVTERKVSREKNLTLDDIMKDKREDTLFLIEIDEQKKNKLESDGKLLPMVILHNRNLQDSSYFTDADMKQFRNYVDPVFEQAKKKIDQGYKIILPEGNFEGKLGHHLISKAPLLYEYYNNKINELIEYGNASSLAEKYLRTKTATVEVKDTSSSNSNSLQVTQSPSEKMKLRYTDDEISDLADFYADRFKVMVEEANNRLIKIHEKELDSTNDSTEKEKIRKKIERLRDRKKKYFHTISEETFPVLVSSLKTHIGRVGEIHRKNGDLDIAARLTDSLEFFDILFSFASPIIFRKTNVKIHALSKSVEYLESSEADKLEEMAEDAEGNYTPEMSFLYNYRYENPYSHLSAAVKTIISQIPMRDPNDRRKFLLNTLGEATYWNPKFIYMAIMSEMASESMADPDRFCTIIPNSELNDKEKERYPIGKPVFPLLKKMSQRYSWAQDVINCLQASYQKGSLKDLFPDIKEVDLLKDRVKIAELGNTVSQFYTNFNEQFITYCTMVAGNIVNDCLPTGEESMRNTAVRNYQGYVTFDGCDMIYNVNGSVNRDNLQKNLKAVKVWENYISSGKNYSEDTGVSGNSNDILYQPIKVLDKENSQKSFDRFVSEKQFKEGLKALDKISNLFKASGVMISTQDLFNLILNPPRVGGIQTLLIDYRRALETLVNLPSDQHIFNSDFQVFEDVLDKRGKTSSNWVTPKKLWNRLFKDFGNHITDREYSNSVRILGKAMYPYTHHSFKSMVTAALVNTNIKERKKYIEDNFFQYEWFYDKNKGVIKNSILRRLYNGENLLTQGHDLLVKKDGYKETEYSNWTPADILQIMFRELSYPKQMKDNAKSICLIMPVASDSTVCSAIEVPVESTEDNISRMVDITRNELGRMRLVNRRGVILKMQALKRRKDLGIELEGDDKKYFDSHEDYYNKWKETHPQDMQEIENFDKNGKKFCFFPELNTYKISSETDDKNVNKKFFERLVRLLAKDPDNPNGNTVSLINAITAIENMSAETYKSKSEYVGLRFSYTVDDYAHAYVEIDEKEPIATKQELISTILEIAICDILSDKVENFLFDKRPSGVREYGKMNDDVVKAVCANNEELRKIYQTLPKPKSNGEVNPEDLPKTIEFQEKVLREVTHFYSNHTASMSEYIQIMATDIAYYKNPDKFSGSVDFAKRWKEVNGAGIRLNTNSKFGKKVQHSIILVDSVKRSKSFNVLESVLDRAVAEGRITRYEKEAVLDKFKFITGTDAQAYRSLTSYRDILDMAGKYTTEIAQCMDNLENNKWTMGDFYTVFNTIKPFTFGPETMDSGIDDIQLRTMVQHKNSEAALFAIYNTLVGSHPKDPNYSSKLRGLNKAMDEIFLEDENHNVLTYVNGDKMRAIDMAQFQSAVKVGAQGAIDINYSRKKMDEVHKDGFLQVGKHKIDVSLEDTYYTLVKKIERLLDSEKISFDEYEKVMDDLEPGEEEVYEIIERAIYKNGDKSLGYDYQVLHKLDFRYFSIQQPTDDHYTDVSDGVFGSQPRHLIMADLPEDFKITINGKEYTKKELKKRYDGLLVANLVQCYLTEIEPLFKDAEDGKGTALEKLQKRIFAMIDDNPKYSGFVKKALQIVEDPKTKKQRFAVPLNNGTMKRQLEELFTSFFKNAIANQEINGGNVILQADVGYSKSLKVLGERYKSGPHKGELIPGGKIEGVECLLPASSRKLFEPYLSEEKVDAEGHVYRELNIDKLKRDGMDKIIGYRIPTEAKYSMLPLIVRGFLPQQSANSIVVAQEVTTLTGSDNDVDKMFLMIKAFTEVKDKDGNLVKDKDGKIMFKPISSPGGDETLDPMKMSKLQRDNEIIDIFWEVLTHPKMSHLWLKAGNFDGIKINADRMRIIKDRKLLGVFMDRSGINKPTDVTKFISSPISVNDANNMYRKIFSIPDTEELDRDKTMLDILEDFIKEFTPPLSPVYPDTFIKMHQIYMAGVAEKGIFANNTLDHAKMQWADVRLVDEQQFSFEGRRIEKVDVIRVNEGTEDNPKWRYISSDCAEDGAAAVDNGKEPKLADLNSNQKTANLFGYMQRLSLGIEGSALLLAQPYVDWMINHEGNIKIDLLEGEISRIGGWLSSAKLDIRDPEFNWRLHNFTKEELYANIVGASSFEIRNTKDKDGKIVVDSKEENRERMKSLFLAYNLVLNLVKQNNALQEPRTILHYDSPNHAISTSLASAIVQSKTVERVNDRKNLADFDRYFTGDDDLLVAGLSNKISSATHNKGEYAWDLLMRCKLPTTQGFYTLGIEMARNEFGPYFVFGRPELQKLTDRMFEYMKTMGVYKQENQIKVIDQMYRDWVVFRLSKTKLFGDDGTFTFDEKRQYYLTVFPEKFQQMKESIKELSEYECIRRLYVVMNNICIDREQRMEPETRDLITNSFDRLFSSSDQRIINLAEDLFKYCYYKNGFEFSFTSFGNLLSPNFLSKFQEYIEALEDMNTEVITEEEINNFFMQFVAKRNNMNLLPYMSFDNDSHKAETLQNSGAFNTRKPIDWWGLEEDVPPYIMLQNVDNGKAKYKLCKYSPSLTHMNGTVVYIPFDSNTTLHYNIRQTLDEMANIVYANEESTDKKMLKQNLNTVNKINYDMASSQEETDYGRIANAEEVNPIDTTEGVSNVAATEDSGQYNVQNVGLTESSGSEVEIDGELVARAAEGETVEEYPVITPKQADSIFGSESPNVSNVALTENAGVTENLDIANGQKIVEENNNGNKICIKGIPQ